MGASQVQMWQHDTVIRAPDESEEGYESDPTAPTPADNNRTRLLPMVVSGVVGAVTVTVLNESARRIVPHAPRMDVMGERGLRKMLRAAGRKPPERHTLYRWTLAADLLSNSMYYSLAGMGSPRGAWSRGAALGLAAGVGAALLPQRVGFGRQPGSRSPMTEILTGVWYFAGGLAAAAMYRALASNR